MQDLLTSLELGDELDWEPIRIVPPDPWTGHLSFAFWLIKALKPRSLVELGTHSGNSYFAFCQAMAAWALGSHAYAVDTWRGDEHSGEYDEEVFAEVLHFNNAHFRQFSTLLRTTFDDARLYFPDASIDLLHIDGMHTYEAVRHDFETWQSALSSRGVVVLHDTNVRERNFGVWRLWQELQARFPSFEFKHSNGLGVLGVGSDQAPLLQALFALSDDSVAANRLRRRIAARGEAFQRYVEIQNLHVKLRSALSSTQKLHDQIEIQAQAAEAQRETLVAQNEVQTQASEAQHEALKGQHRIMQDSLAWREALLESRDELLAARDETIKSIANALDAKSASLVVRDEMIQARDAQAEQLLHDLRHQNFLVNEEKRVRNEMQAGYEDAIGRINADRDALQETIHEISRIYTDSSSWKLTRPLRVASRLVRGHRPQPPLPVLPARQEVTSVASAEDSPAIQDVTQPTELKLAMRRLLTARLQGFLAGSEVLRLPQGLSPDVSIILVLFNQAELTFGCLSSIIETTAGAPFEIEVIIIDNNSADDTGHLLDRLEGATIIRNTTNLHFLKAVNLAARSVTGCNILLLNNDVQLLPGAIASALRTLDSSHDIGAVGGRIILPDGTLQEAGSIIWRDGTCSGYARGENPSTPDAMFLRDVDYCSGAFLLTRTALFIKMGGFNEQFAPAYYEETDYCVRLWEAGYKVVYDPDAAIIHYEFGSSTSSGDALRLQAANHAIFAARHEQWLSKQFPASPFNIMAARSARSVAPRILVMEDRLPQISLGSGYPRSNRLVQQLVEAGADVTFFPMHRHKETWYDVRKTLDKRVEVLLGAEASELHDYLRARPNHFDGFLICRPHNMEAFLKAVGPEWQILGGASVIYDAEALFVRRTLQRREAEGETVPDAERHRMIAEEVALTRMANVVISVAPAEQWILEDYGAPQVHLLGHAVDDRPLPTDYGQRDQIVFLGGASQEDAPNADAIRWFASEILPRLRQELGNNNLRLTVIGLIKIDSVRAMDGDMLDLLGMVDELEPALARARVMVVPTRLAAGIPFKAHQAAILGIPMVVTPIIANQLGWQKDSDLLVADDPIAFAVACRRLYDDKTLWEAVRDNALARVRADCAPEVFSAKVKEIVTSLKIVHRQPEGPTGQSAVIAPAPKAEEPNTSRPITSDWSMAVPFDYTPAPSQTRIAIICHLFHIFVASELAFYLRKFPVPADLLLTTDTEAKQAELRAAFAFWDKGGVDIRVTPNRGRDIAPKLVEFADVYDQYDLVLHLHSKVSDHAAFLTPWRSYLFETLLGSPEVVRSILDAFVQLPYLGMLAPQNYEGVRRWLGWNGNFSTAKSLATRMGVNLSPRQALDFPAGSMFWARPVALRPLLDLKLSSEDFPAESGQVDHTPAHAIERLYFYSCERSGHIWLKLAHPALCFSTATISSITSPTALTKFAAEHGVLLTGPTEVPKLDEPAPMMTRIAPGLANRLAARNL